MARKTGNYDEYHLEWLKNPANAAAFLNSVMEEYDRDAFIQAMRDVASADIEPKKISDGNHDILVYGHLISIIFSGRPQSRCTT